MLMLSRFSGFTLLELMVSIAVLAILLSIGIPSFSSFIDSSQRRAISEGLASAVKVARSEAVTRGVETTLCRRNSAGNACSNDANWSVGWLVIPNASGAAPVRVWDALPARYTLSQNGGAGPITFTAMGSVQNEGVFNFSLADGDANIGGYKVTAIGGFEED
ncbi:GspH/FimT family pseudopilin [Marinobacterium lutimaris]|uniref:Type II secretion system protein H n=1 Tax=Marinobacterium lutimaris TaxID=568106 RepID=A0A1H6CWI1_9GAMM|nr:GspH/FimT family pseudopilin [Marinobacterium lutimaris]SEG76895.1 type IV fimbrial biogenesis protein FimT [Marinobacterium lutimaris]